MRALRAVMVISLVLVTAQGGHAKARPGDTVRTAHSRHFYRPRSGPATAQQFQGLLQGLPGDIYDSQSDGRHLYTNPDRDFSGPNAGGKDYF